jgi:hypothetical protein
VSFEDDPYEMEQRGIQSMGSAVILFLVICLVAFTAGCKIPVEPPPCDRWSENDCWSEK